MIKSAWSEGCHFTRWSHGPWPWLCFSAKWRWYRLSQSILEGSACYEWGLLVTISVLATTWTNPLSSKLPSLSSGWWWPMHRYHVALHKMYLGAAQTPRSSWSHKTWYRAEGGSSCLSWTPLTGPQVPQQTNPLWECPFNSGCKRFFSSFLLVKKDFKPKSTHNKP